MTRIRHTITIKICTAVSSGVVQYGVMCAGQPIADGVPLPHDQSTARAMRPSLVLASDSDPRTRNRPGTEGCRPRCPRRRRRPSTPASRCARGGGIGARQRTIAAAASLSARALLPSSHSRRRGCSSRFARTRSTFQPGRLSPTRLAAPAQLCQRPSTFTKVPELSAKGADGQHHVRGRRAGSRGRWVVAATTKSAPERLRRGCEIVGGVDSAEQ